MSATFTFEKIAIANRGEVAVRIIRACQELGIQTILLHSEADTGTPAARLADEAICIGEAALAESYLNIQSNIDHALSRGADAIHPGFGFLSENADFAAACAARGLTFIGPSPESIRLFGDKISAKKLVEAAGGPVIPGFDGDTQEVESFIQHAEKIGFPVIVKATAGGGGRGLKVIRSKDEARELIESAQREGQAAFGSGRVFLEKYLDRAKHIEVQIFGDASGRVHVLGERECSVQRRHQKIIEEAPAADLPEHLRKDMHEASRRIAEQAKYKSAGTVEFLLQDERFYFMEMNTRLQVEHPVTEMVMGVDLVKAQIMTAMGRAVNWDSRRPQGHAIECRIYAEDPFKNGIPSTGMVGGCHWPYGPGRRFEVGIEEGDEVTSHYDSMIAKVVVWDETRARAIQKMQRTLSETVIFGVRTNIPLLQEILRHSEFVLGTMTTRFFEKNFAKGLSQAELTRSQSLLADQVRRLVRADDVAGAPQSLKTNSPWTHPWGS